MSKLNNSDIEFLRNEYEKVKSEAINYANKDREAKKDFIFRLKRKAEVLFEAEGRAINELCSYIWNDLAQYEQFSIAKSYYYSLFTDSEKGNYSSEFGSGHSHSFELDGDIEKCSCGVIKFNGLLYSVVQEKSEKPEEVEKIPSQEQHDPYSEPIPEYYQRVADNARELASMADSIVNKFYGDKETAKLLEENLIGIDKAIKEQKSLEAELIALSKQMDYRIRIGHFEKIKALLFEKCTKYGIAGVAGLLAPPCIKCGHKGITPKHVSANLMRKDYESIMKKMMYFRTFDVEIDGKTVVIDLNDWFNKQVERGDLNLDIEKPIIVSYLAK